MRKKWWASIAFCTVCFTILITAFIGMEALAIRFAGDGKIIHHLTKAIHHHILSAENAPTSPYGHEGHSYDTFTDCIEMSVNLGNKHEPLLRRLAATPFVGIERNHVVGPCRWLVEDILSGSMHATEPYVRYWHGSLVYTRPLLTYISLADLHKLNAVLLGASLVFLALRVGISFGRLAPVALVLPLVWQGDILSIPAVTVHALTWIWAFVSLGTMARWLKTHPPNQPDTIALVFSLGCVASFLDVLFSPPFAPTFIAFLAIATLLHRQPAVRLLQDAARLVVAWFLGFSLTWAGKWVLSAFVLSWSTVWTDVIGRIEVRSFADPSVAGSATSFLAATRIALAYADQSALAISWVVAALILGTLAWQRRLTLAAGRRYLLMLTPLLISVAWVEVLRDHTMVHPGFASRAFLFFGIIPILAALVLSREARSFPTTVSHAVAVGVPRKPQASRGWE